MVFNKSAEHTRRTVAAVIQSAHSREQLITELKAKGIDVLFRQNDTGRIYGVTFIDHESRTVLNGSRLGKDFSANVFNDLFTGSRTLATGNSKAEIQEHTQGNNPTGHLSEGTGKTVTGLFSLLSGGSDTPPDNSQVPPPKKKKKKKQKRI